ncbi:Pentatricopeptide repeat-containing protein [Drosera capensis]
MDNHLGFYAKTGFVSDAHDLFDEMPLRNMYSWNPVLSGCTKVGMMDVAVGVLGRIEVKDSVSWTTMIVGYARMGCFGSVMKVFKHMVYDGVMPTQFTLTNVLTSCAGGAGLGVGRKVHSFAVKLGLSGVIPVASSLLNLYAKSGDDWACDVFERMVERDIISWNSMVSRYNQHGYDVEALNTFSEMLKSSFTPDRFTLTSALSAYANIRDLKLGKQIQGYMIRTEFNTFGAVQNALISIVNVKLAERIITRSGIANIDMIAFTALLDGYVKLGDIAPARSIFDSLKNRDVVAWTAMIINDTRKAQAESYTLAAILCASSNLASLDHGRQIHAVAIRSRVASQVSVSNALITMYSKAGTVAHSKSIFKLMNRQKDTVSWTSMILALAQHGLGEEAIELLEKMLDFGIKPDHITHAGVLCACIHAGLVEKGRSYYAMMQNAHKIEPTSSHYACMVDLFGRAGLLQEAQDFIETMPIEPDVIAWGSLLASCKVHKNADLAKVAAEQVLVLDPDNSDAFSALANVYSACGRWTEAALIRKSMKEKGMKKEQGLSWLRFNNQVHVFGADDALHPQRDAICKKIDDLWEEIKKMGFVPDTSAVLHDLDEKVKEQLLRHHSEELAIAFGLLSTPDNMTLRIMKNPRVCSDCRMTIKFISKLVGREITVRDATRTISRMVLALAGTIETRIKIIVSRVEISAAGCDLARYRKWNADQLMVFDSEKTNRTVFTQATQLLASSIYSSPFHLQLIALLL